MIYPDRSSDVETVLHYYLVNGEIGYMPSPSF